MKPITRRLPALRYRNRSIQLTPEGTLLLILTLMVGTTAINTGNNLLYFLMTLMLSLILISSVLSEWCLKGIRVQHRIASDVFAGRPSLCRWTVRNKKTFFPSFTLSIEVLYPGLRGPAGISILQIPARSVQHHSSELIFTRRGLQRSPGYKVSTGFPFGLFEKTLHIPFSQEVLVYPKLHRLWNLEGSMVAGEAVETRKKGQGPSLRSLRGYQHGDDPRSIHWKVSARQAKLFVQEHEQEDERKLQICFSNRLNPSADTDETLLAEFEEGVNLTASLALSYAQRGHAVGLTTMERELLPRHGLSHCHKLLHHLALIEPRTDADPKLMNRFYHSLASRPYQVILILTWDDPFWKGRQELFSQVITPAQWKGSGHMREAAEAKGRSLAG